MNHEPPVPMGQPSPFPPQFGRPKKRPYGLYIFGAFVLFALISLGIQMLFYEPSDSPEPPKDSSTQAPAPSTETPGFKVEVVIAGREHIWQTMFLPDSRMLFNERKGILTIINGNEARDVTVPDVKAAGEGGLLGMVVDPKFQQNRYIYMCYNSTSQDIRVSRWRLEQNMSLSSRKHIITGIPTNPGESPGRHSGCRLGFDMDQKLWVGTGDTAHGDTAIQPKNLGGKVLRVTRDGQPVAGNMGGEFDRRIFSYGHRNIQGLAFFTAPKHGVMGLSIEHGSFLDDEVNELRSGNFGWAPPSEGYDESGPMTDKTRFPDAIDAIWSSGRPTQAPSGGTIINGTVWKGWDGALAMAVMKDKHLKILRLNDDNKVTKEEKVLVGTYGRIRSVTQGPDNALYLSTDNGSDDKVIKLSPQ
jgi:glucose/arabinose dehydrogenase